MELPRFDDVEFSPLAWKEWLLYGEESEFPSKRSIFTFLRKRNREGAFEWCQGVENRVRNRRIRHLLNGYAILDLLNESEIVDYLRLKMWRLFEDTVAEIIREVIKGKEECTVAYVDKWPGFLGLDYVITNSKSNLGWKVGVQCKRYIGTRIPYSRVNEYSSYSRGVSAAQLHDKGVDLKKKYSEKRKILLITFNAFRRNKTQRMRFNNLKEVWDSVMVLDDNLTDETPYTYRLRCDKLDKIVRWC